MYQSYRSHACIYQGCTTLQSKTKLLQVGNILQCLGLQMWQSSTGQLYLLLVSIVLHDESLSNYHNIMWYTIENCINRMLTVFLRDWPGGKQLLHISGGSSWLLFPAWCLAFPAWLLCWILIYSLWPEVNCGATLAFSWLWWLIWCYFGVPKFLPSALPIHDNLISDRKSSWRIHKQLYRDAMGLSVVTWLFLFQVTHMLLGPGFIRR